MRSLRRSPTAALIFASCVQLAAAQDVAVDPEAVATARATFVERMVSTHGFDRAEIAATLADAKIDSDILQAISKPAERVVPWYEYRNIFLTPARIEAGVAFWRDNAALVEATARRHDVEPELLLAIVGVESLFGQRMGKYRVLDALSTLAFAYPPRARFFGSELEAFLLMSREEGPHVLEALGSYAGAMGAGQFIPSSFRAYAVDADGDGIRDLWGDWEDILASVANYFDAHGWQSGEPIVAAAVKAASWSGPEPGQDVNLSETVGSLSDQGYLFATDLPATSPAMVFALERDASSAEYWVGFHNFRVITRYNRSVKYALAAHQLSIAIREGYAGAAQSVVQ
jgi:membrane-bound lytic murein transglycosylase B